MARLRPERGIAEQPRIAKLPEDLVWRTGDVCESLVHVLGSRAVLWQSLHQPSRQFEGHRRVSPRKPCLQHGHEPPKQQGHALRREPGLPGARRRHECVERPRALRSNAAHERLQQAHAPLRGFDVRRRVNRWVERRRHIPEELAHLRELELGRRLLRPVVGVTGGATLHFRPGSAVWHAHGGQAGRRRRSLPRDLAPLTLRSCGTGRTAGGARRGYHVQRREVAPHVRRQELRVGELDGRCRLWREVELRRNAPPIEGGLCGRASAAAQRDEPVELREAEHVPRWADAGLLPAGCAEENHALRLEQEGLERRHEARRVIWLGARDVSELRWWRRMRSRRVPFRAGGRAVPGI
mmetsp:Transcript_305/g.1230  ORF Transcript_305/g.1230 Transcript_305/m.1230 type:complete len:353 (-) Transcript_305:52-1110(-)